MKINQCRISGGAISKVVDFGMQPLGNGFLSPNQYRDEYFFPMTVGYSEQSMMLQLIEQPAAVLLIGSWVQASSCAKIAWLDLETFSILAVPKERTASNTETRLPYICLLDTCSTSERETAFQSSPIRPTFLVTTPHSKALQ